MFDMEIWTLVKSKPTSKMLVGRYLLVVLLVFSGCFIIVSPLFFLLTTIILAVVLRFVVVNQRIEYEYSFYDGDIRIAKIRDKRKRRELLHLVGDDVILVAPEGHEALRTYENPNVTYTRMDVSSHEKDREAYLLICKDRKEICKVRFEPDKRLLAAMKEKCPRKIME